jgi:hypothetical protein
MQGLCPPLLQNVRRKSQEPPEGAHEEAGRPAPWPGPPPAAAAPGALGGAGGPGQRTPGAAPPPPAMVDVVWGGGGLGDRPGGPPPQAAGSAGPVAVRASGGGYELPNPSTMVDVVDTFAPHGAGRGRGVGPLSLLKNMQ